MGFVGSSSGKGEIPGEHPSCTWIKLRLREDFPQTLVIANSPGLPHDGS